MGFWMSKLPAGIVLELSREKKHTTTPLKETLNFLVPYKKINKVRRQALPGWEPQGVSLLGQAACCSSSLPSLLSSPLFLLVVLPSIRIRSVEKSGYNTTSVNISFPCHSSLRAGIGEKPACLSFGLGVARGELVFIHCCIPGLP